MNNKLTLNSLPSKVHPGESVVSVKCGLAELSFTTRWNPSIKELADIFKIFQKQYLKGDQSKEGLFIKPEKDAEVVEVGGNPQLVLDEDQLQLLSMVLDEDIIDYNECDIDDQECIDALASQGLLVEVVIESCLGCYAPTPKGKRVYEALLGISTNEEGDNVPVDKMQQQ